MQTTYGQILPSANMFILEIVSGAIKSSPQHYGMSIIQHYHSDIKLQSIKTELGLITIEYNMEVNVRHGARLYSLS